MVSSDPKQVADEKKTVTYGAKGLKTGVAKADQSRNRTVGKGARNQPPGNEKPAEPTPAEKRQIQAFNKWWDNYLNIRGGDYPGVPFAQFKNAAKAAWLAGTTPAELTRLFTERAAAIFSPNSTLADGNLGTPYGEYFSDPAHFASLLEQLKPGGAASQYGKGGMDYAEFLAKNPDGTLEEFAKVNIGGVQQGFFDANKGLYEAYQSAVGYKQSTSGRWYDPTKYQELASGAIAPLPGTQPDVPATVYRPYESPGGNFHAPTALSQVADGIAGAYAAAVRTGDYESAQAAHQALQQHQQFVETYNAVAPAPRMPSVDHFTADEIQYR